MMIQQASDSDTAIFTLWLQLRHQSPAHLMTPLLLHEPTNQQHFGTNLLLIWRLLCYCMSLPTNNTSTERIFLLHEMISFSPTRMNVKNIKPHDPWFDDSTAMIQMIRKFSTMMLFDDPKRVMTLIPYCVRRKKEKTMVQKSALPSTLIPRIRWD